MSWCCTQHLQKPQQQQQQAFSERILGKTAAWAVEVAEVEEACEVVMHRRIDGDLSLAAVTAAAAAEVVAGSLHILASDAAAAAGSLGHIWATTVAAGNAAKQQPRPAM